VPSLALFTATFASLAAKEAAAMGMADLRIATVPHPLDKMSVADVTAAVGRIVDDVSRALIKDRGLAAMPPNPITVATEPAARVAVTGAESDVYEDFLARGWTDGLPIVVPTPARVDAMLAGTRRSRDEVVGIIPPNWAKLTVEKLAVNAVMAGCRPEYMPVLIAAVDGMCDPAFNLYGVQATTNPATPMLVVNGPAGKRLGIRAGAGALGPGWRANTTIGRAIRLVLTNVGGGIPGDTDRATHGMPGKLFFCCAENEDDSPWVPFHVERGFSPRTSVVTVIPASGSLNLLDQGSLTADGVLKTLENSLRIVGSNNSYAGGEPVLLISPEHAATLNEGGVDKRKLRDRLFERGRVPLDEFSTDNVDRVIAKRRPHLFEHGRPRAIPAVDRADDLLVFVVGGPGKHSVFVGTFGVGLSATRVIAEE
jgi:hypothetical protein